MEHLKFIFFILVISAISSCIKDDFVEDTIDTSLRIVTNIATLEIDSEVQFDAMYLNNVGQLTDVDILWSSSDTNIISVSKEGLAKAIDFGTVTIIAEYSDGVTSVRDEVVIEVGESTVAGENSVTGNIVSTSSYVLEGEFNLTASAGGINILFNDTYKASTALPGLFLYLSNNRNSIADALEVSAVNTFEGAHQYDVSGVGVGEYKYLLYFCKPFNVKVGDGEL